MLWYRDRAAWRMLALRYLPWLAALNLGWEAVHVPLYTLWSEASPGYIAFSIVHCTLGDVLIGTAALALALIAGRERTLEGWRWRRLAALTAFFGIAYTVFSEWMNTKVLASWAYAKAMPTLQLAEIEIGWTPLLQWLLLPPVALYLSRRRWDLRWSGQV
ncbi:MAG: hypothetical protein ACT4P3_15430 [Betaproteobacteria bacterium]